MKFRVIPHVEFEDGTKEVLYKKEIELTRETEEEARESARGIFNARIEKSEVNDTFSDYGSWNSFRLAVREKYDGNGFTDPSVKSISERVMNMRGDTYKG